MATIVRLSHPSNVPSTVNAHSGALAQIEDDLNMLQRKIEAYSRLIAECAAELCHLERRMQVLRQTRSFLLEGDTASDADQVLSEREREVLRLVGCGLRNAEISVLLSISEGTVKNHISAILAKLTARSRWDAVIKARELGLI